ncbi:hypothetical protein EYF80_013236 [Liparis tanakae]|uniref:Uncharacterized protein n=1 Tax=Liparis tanakae TaxID=230148 RepID=A0A4Z2IF57_9TELE|nr:hypothetical protein EYF80_013236 [Liparis tanakae]
MSVGAGNNLDVEQLVQQKRSGLTFVQRGVRRVEVHQTADFSLVAESQEVMHPTGWLTAALQCSHAAVRADNAVPLVPPQVNTFSHF